MQLQADWWEHVESLEAGGSRLVLELLAEARGALEEGDVEVAKELLDDAAAQLVRRGRRG